MYNTSDSFYLDKPEPVKGCLLALRDIILQSNPQFSETVKYGMPCFTFNKKAICYLWTDKSNGKPYLLFVDGKQLQYPELEQGKRARMKTLRVNPTADLPVKSIRKILNAALALHKK